MQYSEYTPPDQPSPLSIIQNHISNVDESQPYRILVGSGNAQAFATGVDMSKVLEANSIDELREKFGTYQVVAMDISYELLDRYKKSIDIWVLDCDIWDFWAQVCSTPEEQELRMINRVTMSEQKLRNIPNASFPVSMFLKRRSEGEGPEKCSVKRLTWFKTPARFEGDLQRMFSPVMHSVLRVDIEDRLPGGEGYSLAVEKVCPRAGESEDVVVSMWEDSFVKVHESLGQWVNNQPVGIPESAVVQTLENKQLQQYVPQYTCRNCRCAKGVGLWYIYHAMRAQGPYDVQKLNCHDAAFHVMQLCAGDDYRLSNNPLWDQKILAKAGGLAPNPSACAKEASRCSAGGISTLIGLTKDPHGLGKDHQKAISSADWCISPNQLGELLEDVDKVTGMAAEKLTTSQMVERVIKPATINSGLSYALQKNIHGLSVKYFITHNWRYRFKRLGGLVKELFSARGEGNIWACFVSNPQNWGDDALNDLLGESVWQSPFALALREAQYLVVARDAELNIYERLWCVLERALAAFWNKPCIFIGPPTPRARIDRKIMGMHASATEKADIEKGSIFLRNIAEHSKTKEMLKKRGFETYAQFLNELCYDGVTQPEDPAMIRNRDGLVAMVQSRDVAGWLNTVKSLALSEVAGRWELSSYA